MIFSQQNYTLFSLKHEKFLIISIISVFGILIFTSTGSVGFDLDGFLGVFRGVFRG
jgi:hypothetical protein